MLEEKKLQTDFTKSPKYFSFGTQPIVPHVKFTWKELHVNFTLIFMWNSHEIHVKFVWSENHVNYFMWISRETSSREIHVKITWLSHNFNVKSLSREIHVNFTWNFKQFLNNPDYFFSRCVFYFSTGWELLNSIYNTFDYTKVIYNQITVMHNNKNPLAI